MMRLALTCLLVAAVGCAHGRPVPDSAAPDAELGADQLLEVAVLAERIGDGLRAQQYLLSARERGADDNKTLPWLLRLYVADGQYRAAIDTARASLEQHPDQLPLRMLLASLYEATALDIDAIDQYERVLSRAPSEPRAHYALASLLHRHQQERLRADQHFRAYLALEPDGPHAERARSLLLKELP
ncbi:MAG: tetratricopeptide repeat protein [Polyangiales bacterium]